MASKNGESMANRRRISLLVSGFFLKNKWKRNIKNTIKLQIFILHSIQFFGFANLALNSMSLIVGLWKKIFFSKLLWNYSTWTQIFWVLGLCAEFTGSIELPINVLPIFTSNLNSSNANTKVVHFFFKNFLKNLFKFDWVVPQLFCKHSFRCVERWELILSP